MSILQVGFGGGCHWCTEAVFNALGGVKRVQQGFIKSKPPHNNYSEAVIVTFDSAKIPILALIEIHLRTHACTSDHKLRGKYRSAVYVFSEGQETETKSVISALQAQFDNLIVTQVLPFHEFRPSTERFQTYYEKNAGGQFCTRHIDPKLDLIKQEYSELLKKE